MSATLTMPIPSLRHPGGGRDPLPSGIACACPVTLTESRV